MPCYIKKNRENWVISPCDGWFKSPGAKIFINNHPNDYKIASREAIIVAKVPNDSRADCLALFIVLSAISLIN